MRHTPEQRERFLFLTFVFNLHIVLQCLIGVNGTNTGGLTAPTQLGEVPKGLWLFLGEGSIPGRGGSVSETTTRQQGQEPG